MWSNKYPVDRLIRINITYNYLPSYSYNYTKHYTYFNGVKKSVGIEMFPYNY